MAGRVVVVAALAIAAAVATFAWLFRLRNPDAPRLTVSINRPLTPPVDPLRSRIIRSGPMSRPRDFFQVIDAPQFLAVAEAAGSMSDDEIVIALDLNGMQRAYPINYLNEHEMVRDQIGDVPLLVTW